MDKKNSTIGIVLLLAAFAVLMLAPRSPAPTKPANAQTATAATTPGTSAPAAAAAPNSTFAAVAHENSNAQVATLSNDVVEVRLTSNGGAIREVALKKFADVQGQPEPYVFNHLHEDPILAFTDFPGLGRDAHYELVSSSPTEVVFRAVVDGKLEVTRRYRFTDPSQPGGDPYRLRHETTFRNLTGAPYPLPQAALSLGTSALINAQDTGIHLNVASFDGSSATYIDRGDLSGGGIGSLFGAGNPPKNLVEKPVSVVWAAIKNQFFASVYTPDTPGVAIVARRIELPSFANDRQNVGMTGAAKFALPTLAANGSATLSGQLFVGPKEYKRLQAFGRDEDRVMQYDRYFFNRIFLSRYVAPLENTLLNAAHRWSGNWGVAVILMTLMLKLVSLPFTLAASRSAKRMAKLQPEMKALREKYKDNPQKQQAATMELFKQHKVNPVGGCIPVLITFPLFVGFYAMLGGAAELRYQPFLWAPDLSAPDTVTHLFGFPVNIMPLLMGVTMLYQMRLTPQPSVDNAQATMMKFMPIIFIAFCYNFSCALALYSTINGLFTIGQQLVINRMKDAGPAGPGTAAATTISAMGRPVKNVTPKKKR